MSEFLIGTSPTSVTLLPCLSAVCYDQRCTALQTGCLINLISLIFIRGERYPFIPVYECDILQEHLTKPLNDKQKGKLTKKLTLLMLEVKKTDRVRLLSSKCPWVSTRATLFMCSSRVTNVCLKQISLPDKSTERVFQALSGREGWIASLFFPGCSGTG